MSRIVLNKNCAADTGGNGSTAERRNSIGFAVAIKVLRAAQAGAYN